MHRKTIIVDGREVFVDEIIKAKIKDVFGDEKDEQHEAEEKGSVTLALIAICACIFAMIWIIVWAATAVLAVSGWLATAMFGFLAIASIFEGFFEEGLSTRERAKRITVGVVLVGILAVWHMGAPWPRS